MISKPNQKSTVEDKTKSVRNLIFNKLETQILKLVEEISTIFENLKGFVLLNRYRNGGDNILKDFFFNNLNDAVVRWFVYACKNWANGFFFQLF